MSGLLAPAKTPDAVVQSLNAALVTALKDPEVQTRLRELGSEPRIQSPSAFGKFLADEDAKAEKLIRDGILRPE